MALPRFTYGGELLTSFIYSGKLPARERCMVFVMENDREFAVSLGQLNYLVLYNSESSHGCVALRLKIIKYNFVFSLRFLILTVKICLNLV